VDDWLDNHIHEKAVLLVSSVYLEPENLATTAESACVLLLANRLTQDELIPRALLHRPERITTIEQLQQALNKHWTGYLFELYQVHGAQRLNTKQRAVLLSSTNRFAKRGPYMISIPFLAVPGLLHRGYLLLSQLRLQYIHNIPN
jgi:hypothetical protein